MSRRRSAEARGGVVLMRGDYAGEGSAQRDGRSERQTRCARSFGALKRGPAESTLPPGEHYTTEPTDCSRASASGQIASPVVWAFRSRSPEPQEKGGELCCTPLRGFIKMLG
jgi:hypothetical protein